MSAELLPCPFCGGTNIALAAHPQAGRGFDHHGDTVYSIDCMGCGASFPNRYRREILVEQWNTRAASPQATATQPAQTVRELMDEQRIAIEAALSISDDIENERHDGSFLSEESKQALGTLLTAAQPESGADHD